MTTTDIPRPTRPSNHGAFAAFSDGVKQRVDQQWLAKFQVGQVYTTGETRDYVWHFKVIARTDKFITIQDRWGETSRVAVTTYEGIERAYPLGRYSMAPPITANKIAPEDTAR